MVGVEGGFDVEKTKVLDTKCMDITGQKLCTLWLPHKCLENFSKDLWGKMGGTHNVGSFCPVMYVYYVTLRAWWPKVLVHFQTITCSLLYLQTKQNKLRNWSEVKIEAVAKRKLQIISYYNYTQRHWQMQIQNNRRQRHSEK